MRQGQRGETRSLSSSVHTRASTALFRGTCCLSPVEKFRGQVRGQFDMGQGSFCCPFFCFFSFLTHQTLECRKRRRLLLKRVRLEGGTGPLWWCVTEVEVGPHLVQLSGVRRALEFWDLPSTQLRLQSRLCLPEKKRRKEKKKSSICLTLLPPPPGLFWSWSAGWADRLPRWH